MIEKRHSNYRWYLLALTMLTYAVITGLERMCMPVLFNEISADLGLSMVAIGTVWGMDPLAGVFIGLPGGLLADRFGVKRMLTVLCVLAGVFGALRGFSVNFVTMAGTMFFFGLMAAATPSVVPKMTAEWFGGRQLGMANALINVAWAVGSMAATMFSATLVSPWLGGWRNVMFLYGVPAVLLGFLWLFTGRERERPDLPGTPPVKAVPFRQSLARIIRIKQVWLIGFIMLATWGANMGFIGYLPLYLEGQGWSTTAASSTITLVGGMGMVGAIPTVLIAERTSRKRLLTLSLAAMVLSVGLLPLVSGTGIWLMIIFGGLMRSGTQALYTVMIFETEGIGSAYGGTAVGLANTIAMAGAFAAPPLGNSLASINAGAPLVFWGSLTAVALPLLYMVKDKRGSRNIKD
jgi:predicted MFS family arabinose efflux permease